MERKIYEGWYKASDGSRIPDLKKYVLEKLSERTVGKAHDVNISIGTDAAIKKSKNSNERVISNMTVIVFKNGNNGAHIICRRDVRKAKSYIPIPVKLNGEVELTSELGFWFQKELGISPEVHLDLNPKQTAGSFSVYKYIQGYFESLGFTCFYKPQSFSAMCAADYYA